MSKSLGNTTAPQDVIKQSGADILRLWALSSDYTEDLRIGPHIIQSTVDAYRKLRNTLRYLLGNLAHYEPGFEVPHADMPELERWVLHRVAEIDAEVRAAYNAFDFKKAYRLLAEFCSNDLSAIYFDIRKDTLYCEAYSSVKRRAALSVLNTLFESLTAWLAPLLCFTAEEAWLARHGDLKDGSVHLQSFPEIPAEWRNDALGEKWEKVWTVRRVITGALEVERREKRIGSSLEAAPEIYIGNKALAAAAKASTGQRSPSQARPRSRQVIRPRMRSRSTRWKASRSFRSLRQGRSARGPGASRTTWGPTRLIQASALATQPPFGNSTRARLRSSGRKTSSRKPLRLSGIAKKSEVAFGMAAQGRPLLRGAMLSADDLAFLENEPDFERRHCPRYRSHARNCARCSRRTPCGSFPARHWPGWSRP